MRAASGSRRLVYVPGPAPTPPARRATADDLDVVVEVLVAAHLDYAWEAWALPDGDRASALTMLYRTDLVELAFPFGEVWRTACGRSAAVWLPAEAFGLLDDVRRGRLDCAARDAFGDRFDVLAAVDEVIGAARPSADWYLATMGTRPDAQRLGLGRAVAAPRLAALDATGATAALETSTPGNVAFYRRLGFDVVAELAELPHGAPTTWVMHRRPG